MIIGFCNEKGGVGKTTLAIHTATWLSRRGHRVVLMDLDTQGGVSHFLGVEPADDVAELVRTVLFLSPERRPSITSFLHSCPNYPSLALLRGYTATGDVEADLRQPGHPRPSAVLGEAVSFLVSHGVVVVVDTGPYAGKLQEAVLEVADHVFVPGIPEGATEVGILKTGQHLHRLGRSITGLIPMRVVMTSAKHKRTIADWKDTVGLGATVYYEPANGLVGLPQRVVWGQLYRTGRPIWDVTPDDVFTTRAGLEMARREMRVVMERLELDVGLRIGGNGNG